GQQGPAFLVILRSRGDGDIQTTNLVYLVIFHFRENDLFGHAHCVVTTTVERPRVQATEVTNTGNRDINQAIKKIVHTLATQGDFGTNGPARTNLETCDGFTRLGDNRLLTTDHDQVCDSVVQQLLVAHSLTYAHIQYHLGDTG